MLVVLDEIKMYDQGDINERDENMNTVVDEVAVTTPRAQRNNLMGGANDLSSAKNLDEALVLAGLDWEPTLRPLSTEWNGKPLPTGHNAVQRDDNGVVLGVVGEKWQPVGNRELGEFGQALVDEADIPWEVGGELGDGKMTFLQFKLPHTVTVAGMDPVDTWVMASNGHGGNAALTATLMPKRLFCGNQVQSGRLQGAHYRIRHSGNIASKLEDARAVLGLSVGYMNEFEVIANRLAEIDVDTAFFEDFIDELLPIDAGAGVRSAASTTRQRGQFRQNWVATETLDPELKLTGWGALNVVTEVIDHGTIAVRKSSLGADERRFRSVMSGAGAKLRERAFDLLLDEADSPFIVAKAGERRLALAGAN